MALEELAKAFALLIDESVPISERLKVKIPGFGSGAVSEILFSVDPNKYPIYNKKFVVGAKALGYEVGELEHVIRLTPGILEKLRNVHERILHDFSKLWDHVRREVGMEIPKFDFTDALLWKVAQEEILISDLLPWREKPSVPNEEEIMEIMGILGKGVEKYLELVNKGENRERTIEKVTFYVEGMIEARGIGRNVGEVIKALNDLVSNLLEVLH
ncbi:hypothetical protein DRN82_03270 [Thermococci archaeon]|nr:MAG: hypothetical protein DRN82_03270 [Thermococci archaeon]